ncbi:Uncharacterised protein [Vibrio cholerae]|nr:Uncharacterised protein [Vibrio cholerae]
MPRPFGQFQTRQLAARHLVAQRLNSAQHLG